MTSKFNCPTLIDLLSFTLLFPPFSLVSSSSYSITYWLPSLYVRLYYQPHDSWWFTSVSFRFTSFSSPSSSSCFVSSLDGNHGDGSAAGAFSETARQTSSQTDQVIRIKNNNIEGTWKDNVPEEEYPTGDAAGNDRAGGGRSPPVSASYYPYAMDRLDDAMSEIPFDNFQDLWKFVDNEDNQEVEDASPPPASSQEEIAPMKQHPRDITLPSPGTGRINVNSNKNKNLGRRNQVLREEEQLIQNPRTGGVVKRVRATSSSNLPSNPVLAQVLGISIELVSSCLILSSFLNSSMHLFSPLNSVSFAPLIFFVSFFLLIFSPRPRFDCRSASSLSCFSGFFFTADLCVFFIHAFKVLSVSFSWLPLVLELVFSLLRLSSDFPQTLLSLDCPLFFFCLLRISFLFSSCFWCFPLKSMLTLFLLH